MKNKKGYSLHLQNFIVHFTAISLLIKKGNQALSIFSAYWANQVQFMRLPYLFN